MMEGSFLQTNMMKGMTKGKILKKLKSIKQVGYLKPDRILQVRAAEGFVDSIQKISNFVSKKTEQGGLGLSLRLEKQGNCDDGVNVEINDVVGEEGGDDGGEMEVEDKENVRPLNRLGVKDSILEPPLAEIFSKDLIFEAPLVENHGKDSILKTPLSEIDVSSFRRPDMDSFSLFDPKLLEAFEEARRVQKLICIKGEERLFAEAEEPPLKVQKTDHDPLTEFELKCPPGGQNAVVLYSTTLHTVRKTFEDCQSIRFLLQTLKVQFFERDVSMHSVYKTEMCGVLGDENVVPPQLFVKGRHVGGAEEVVRLHEAGRFRVLLEGIGVDEGTGVCEGCGGMRFLLCFRCCGSRRVEEDGGWVRCGGCNENGLIVCPYCC